MIHPTFETYTEIPPGFSGWIVGWQSNQLTATLPQWPRIRVDPSMRIYIAIDPTGKSDGLICDSNPEAIRVAAVIEPDEQPADLGKVSRLILPFPPFHVRKVAPNGSQG